MLQNRDSLAGWEEEGGAHWRAWKHGMLQMRTHQQEGRKREESICELGNMAHHRGLTCWRAGRGRSMLVSSEMWHVANEDSLARGEEEGGGRSGLVTISELGNAAHHKQGLTHWREERGRCNLL